MKKHYSNAWFQDFPETGMTYGQALNRGYKETGERTAQPGYLAHKYVSEMDRPVYMGRGARKGQLFVLEPSGKRSQCYRVYLSLQGGDKK